MRTTFKNPVSGWRHPTVLIAVTGLLLALAEPPLAQAQRGDSQAIPGRPFGVAAVTFTTNGETADDPLPIWIHEQDGRAFYPAFAVGALQSLLAEVNGPATGSGSKTVLFLFTGDAPLRLTVHAPNPIEIALRPERESPRVQNRLLLRWWREYNSAAGSLARGGDYPPLIQNYLVGMLGQRLGLRPPLLARLRQDRSDDWQQMLGLLLGTEQLHDSILRDTMATPRASMPADQPVPNEVAWQAPAIALDSKPDLEPLASHTPEECFYVRFGNFDNYMWLEDLMTSYGGDVSRMVTARGQDPKAGDRMRRQLSLPQSALAKIVGGSLIQDVALIGRDMYTQNGAAVGVLFHARNTTLLSVSINQQRNLTLSSERSAGATLETVQIGGRNVSFLSTPDNRVRSFYAIDGDFHLVTTSRRIAERFLEAGQGNRCLADLTEFQHARVEMPLSRNDTIFAFLSTPFLTGLLSPQYQIELQRRIQALVDLELVKLAQLAAEAEGQRSATLEDLIAGSFLPAGFGRQPDGSGPIVEPTRTIDSLRGARGTFLPIPDVDLRLATAAEAAHYNSQARDYFERWQQLDPVMAAIRRETLADKREHITIDARISPLAEEKYGKFLSILGPPVTQSVVPRAGDVISAQAFVTGGQFSAIIPPHLLFVGVQDLETPGDLSAKGLLQWLRLLRTTPGYLGAWPKPGFLDWLPFQGDPNPAVGGLSRLPFDAWRWQADGFSVLSFHRGVLDSVSPQLLIAEADEPAQIRVQVGNLDQSRLRGWVNSLYYQRAWQTSAANTQLLQALTQQLRVPTDQALTVAEALLDTQLVCPLGGKYELAPTRSGSTAWHSTAWDTFDRNVLPPTYQAPLLQWFRGLEVSLTKSADQLWLHSEMDLQR